MPLDAGAGRDDDEVSAADGILTLHSLQSRTDDALDAVALDGTALAFGHRQTDPIDILLLRVRFLQLLGREILENIHRHKLPRPALSPLEGLSVQVILLDGVGFHVASFPIAVRYE